MSGSDLEGRNVLVTEKDLREYDAARITPLVDDVGAAFTQTYSTADRTVPAATAAVLTVADGAGTNDNSIAAITDNATTIAAVQELADEINKLVADGLQNRKLINAIIDTLQATGLVES